MLEPTIGVATWGLMSPRNSFLALFELNNEQHKIHSDYIPCPSSLNYIPNLVELEACRKIGIASKTITSLDG